MFGIGYRLYNVMDVKEYFNTFFKCPYDLFKVAFDNLILNHGMVNDFMAHFQTVTFNITPEVELLDY